jgi:hypothetical protein
MADSYDYIQRLKEELAIDKKEITPEAAARHFALNPAPVRRLHLLNLQTPKEMTVIQAAERHRWESAIRKTHATLNKVGR